MGPRTDIRPDHPGGVDLYVGGVEHAVLHLLYSRFWHKVLFDLGHVSSKEPYARLFNQGYIQAAAYKDEREIYVDATKIEGDERSGFTYEGKPVTREWGKMGKSLKNAVVARRDVRRSTAPTRCACTRWRPARSTRHARGRPRDVVGMYRFLQRLWRNVVDEQTGECTVIDVPGRRRDPQAAAPHDRRRAHRDGRAALQHGDRQADRAEQRRHEARRNAPRGRRAAGADARAAGAAHRRGAVAAPRPRRHDHLRRRSPTPTRRCSSTTPSSTRSRSTARSAATSTVAADADAGDRRGSGARRRQGDRRRSAGATPKKVIVVPGRMVNIVV